MWAVVLALLLIVAIMGRTIYKRLYHINVSKQIESTPYLLIPTGSDFDDVVTLLKQKNALIDENSFRWTAEQMKYTERIKPGRYKIEAGMNNKELIALLRSGRQSPVNLVFNNIRTKEQLAFRVAEQIEAGPDAVLNLLNDPDYTAKLGFTVDNVLSLFIPNTYEMYWNTSADKFIVRMHQEYQKFWTQEKMKKAELTGLTPIEVSILASIVQQESNKKDEAPLIAGVYMNRLKKDWKLEADPTLVYAAGDFSIKRVLNIHKKIDSPYNTYKYKGLPPGPICLPEIVYLNSVLDYSQHSYMYFCAKDDFSGYHNFATNYIQHLLNARKFQRALNKRGIKS
ncbi:MAG: endolytic transglycosylase MltG [Bacteroidetes bacterium]|nr:MAG: endolytic transglycosylase MltG [Bacteroidota bacterium]REK00064.1 MAG: endolytic transglycosylase MltG [Bacteroidota bacterium]REK34284.1 MAG: endolytic transglycosylase MltG [Bacteroidota bacterium]REK50694.1 MAG: endolytic transglycosylase MltG [Bacteroidota bacterium]